ncbi:MAG: hypothetical protein AB7T63_09385 [Planctomycetota bacterium]
MSNPAPGSAPRPRSSRGEGGLGARLEATLKERAPQPKGKGVVMLVLALAVVVAVIVDMRRREGQREEIAEERAAQDAAAGGKNPAEGTPAAGTPTGTPPATPPAETVPLDAGLAKLPPPPDELPDSMEWVLKLMAFLRTPDTARQAALVTALETAPPETRQVARVYLAERIEASLREGRERTGAYMAFLARLADEPGAAPLPDRLRERMAAHAGLLLDSPDAAEGAILLLGSLPESERAARSLLRVLADDTRPLAVRVLAAVALPRPLPPEARALAEDTSTPAWLVNALR